MKKKAWILSLIAGIIFISIAIDDIVNKHYEISTILYLMAGIAFVISSVVEYKKLKK